MYDTYLLNISLDLVTDSQVWCSRVYHPTTKSNKSKQLVKEGVHTRNSSSPICSSVSSPSSMTTMLPRPRSSRSFRAYSIACAVQQHKHVSLHHSCITSAASIPLQRGAKTTTEMRGGACRQRPPVSAAHLDKQRHHSWYQFSRLRWCSGGGHAVKLT